VAQIARTIAQQLDLNIDLVEALALVHDVGHPPFGHAGEKALDAAMRRYGSFFDHNLHALRIVEDFEMRYAAFRGLNLTFEVREGIVKHSHDYPALEFPELSEYRLSERPPTVLPTSTTAMKRASWGSTQFAAEFPSSTPSIAKWSISTPMSSTSCASMRP
jgi:dGTP triphosphohydrolase